MTTVQIDRALLAELEKTTLDKLAELVKATLDDAADPERFAKAEVYLAAAVDIKKGPIKSRDEYIKDMLPALMGLLKNQFAKMGFDLDIADAPEA